MARGVRDGWAAAAKAIAEAGDDVLVWPEFGISTDDEWYWPLSQPRRSREGGKPGPATKRPPLVPRFRGGDK
jgi:hypothetical protein